MSLPFSGLSDETRTTSAAAAVSMSERAVTLRQMVFEAIEAAQDLGLTDAEIQDLLEMPGNTQRPRRIELLQMGRIQTLGNTRPTKSGRSAVVWVATQ